MLARYEEDFEADSDATEEGEGEQGAQGAQGAAGGGATGGEDGVMEATLRDRGGAGQSCYGGFAACQVTRSTSELSDRSPGAAPVAAPEVAALEKTLKQLQLEVAARNQACNPVCRSPPPRVSSLQPCVARWRTRRHGARPTVRSAARVLVETGLLVAPQLGSPASSDGPAGC